MKSTFLDRLKAMAFEEVNTTLRAEAEARGRAEGRLDVLTRLLRARLGRGAARWVKAASSVDEETFYALVDALAVVWTKDEYLAALERVLGSGRAPRRPTRRPTRSTTRRTSPAK